MKCIPWLASIVLLAGTGAVAMRQTFHVASVRAQDAPVRKKGSEPAARLPTVYFGVQACRTCHTTPQEKGALVCRCDEVKRWEGKDKHEQAFALLVDLDPVTKTLKNPVAQRMKEALGISDYVKDPKARSCVSCHTGTSDPDAKLHPSFQYSEGVSCAICHGPHKAWVDLHGSVLQREEWQKEDRLTKEAKYGMADLWDPLKRAVLCVSCHVGDAAQGRVVTHEMYAAGHPPLPGFEPATFSNEMPRHWELLAEKATPPADKSNPRSGPLPKRLLDLYNYDPAAGRLEQTEFMMVASLVSLRSSMSLLKAHSAETLPEPWPEFAQFDCYACHHELKKESWRQARGYKGRPGRPAMRDWPFVLARLTLEHADGADKGPLVKELDQQLAKLQKAFDAQPFGKQADIAAVAGSLDDWITRQALPAVQAMKVTRSDAVRFLQRLEHANQAALHDYDSARQLAWVYEIVESEANVAHDKERTEALRRLNDRLRLRLPTGQVPVANYLRELNEYDPFAFRADFMKLFGQR